MLGTRGVDTLKDLKELPVDSLEESLRQLREITGPLKAVPTIQTSVCDWHMNDYVDMVKADYRRGWEDAMMGNSNLNASIHYAYGYDDCKEWKLSNGY